MLVDSPVVFGHQKVTCAGVVLGDKPRHGLKFEIIEADESTGHIRKGFRDRRFGLVCEMGFAVNLEAMDGGVQRFRHLAGIAAKGNPLRPRASSLIVKHFGFERHATIFEWSLGLRRNWLPNSSGVSHLWNCGEDGFC